MEISLKVGEDLREIVSNERPEEGLEDFVEEFLQDRTQELSKIKLFCENKDFQEISKLAHKWKGFSAPYGFNYLGELAKRIQKACDEADYKVLKDSILEIEEYLKAKVN